MMRNSINLLLLHAGLLASSSFAALEDEFCDAALAELDDVNTECECVSIDTFKLQVSCNFLCLRCNLDRSVCAEASFGTNIDYWEDEFEYFWEITYVKGQSDVLRFTSTETECQLLVNAAPCSLCSITTCDDGTEGPTVDCSNIPSVGQSYNSCDDDFFTGPFQVFNGDGFEDVCDASCGAVFEPCSGNTDCCSGKCFDGVCRSLQVSVGKAQYKMGSERGGAAGRDRGRQGGIRGF
jgi:hypothetical protein